MTLEFILLIILWITFTVLFSTIFYRIGYLKGYQHKFEDMYLLKFKFRSDIDTLEKELIRISNLKTHHKYELDSSIIKTKHLKKHIDQIDIKQDFISRK